MKLKDFMIEVGHRLDEKPSWGKNEVKSLLKDTLIAMYERETNGTNGTADNKGESKKDGNSLADTPTPPGQASVG
jgi:hypothetical protein